jgi:uncharacterized protein (DUF362 family)
MHRRTFLATTAAAAAAGIINPRHIFGSTGSRLITAEHTDYRELVRETIKRLGGMSAFIKPGDTVVIKPNISWDRKPEYGATTNPLILTTLIDLAVEADARSVLVFDRPCNEARSSYINSGIGPAVEAMTDRRIRIMHVEDRHFVKTKIPRGVVLKEWPIHREALQADCYINLPIAKHHGLTGLTLGLKNNMGLLGGNRGLIHADIDRKLADLATIVPTKLTVIDATRIMTRHGPQGGSLDDVKVMNRLIATADPVAADAFAATLFDQKPESLQSTVNAYKMGLGEIDLDKMDIIRMS